MITVRRSRPVELDARDLERFARDQIRVFIGQRFKERNLERLVAALLKAEGYQTQQAPVGADGGVDIVAGRGTMGFEPPRLCVQVKSSDQPADVKILRELQGVMTTFGAQQGLLVFALGGAAGTGQVLAFSIGAQASIVACNILLGLVAALALFGHVRLGAIRQEARSQAS